MSSMKRGDALRAQACRTSSPSSSSLTPPITTVLSLTCANPAAAAASMPARMSVRRAPRPHVRGDGDPLLAQGRLPAREANPPDPEAREDPDQARDLGPGEDGPRI